MFPNTNTFKTGFWFLSVLIVFQACKPMKEIIPERTPLDTGWRLSDLQGMIRTPGQVPGSVHTDLLKEGLIEDPFFRTNEKDLQWIDKQDWQYETSFELSRKDLHKDHLDLVFEGLDTYADIYFNDSLVLQSENMFRTHRIGIKPLAVKGTNSLRVFLHSPIKKGLEKYDHSPYPYPASNDQSENGGLGSKKVSVFTRKAGYHYGWDWGPRLVTSGIWRPVRLESWNDMRIADVFVRQPMVSEELAQLEFEIELRVERALIGIVRVQESQSDDILAESTVELDSGTNSLRIPVSISNPRLWWSNGLGEPHLYSFDVVVLDPESGIRTRKSITTGLRSIRLFREKDSIGESFYFELNGVPVFAKGANYIPNDSFLNRVTREDYEKVVQDAVDANMNMLRIWGGGIYEDDYFYELCDAKGILLWQDFMFACSMYPGDAEFLESVRQEAIDNVVRLRNHPSIALWCGNNEINTAWNYYSEGGWGWKERYSSREREEINSAYEELFHELLPEVVRDYTDGKDYWPSSPQSGYADMHANFTSGDMHYWGVWHAQHPFEDFEKNQARFMSEYGFQSFPDIETVKKYALPEDFNIESEVMAWHQRSGIGNLRIREYMARDYRVPKDFEEFLYVSQILQARGMRMGIESHRRAMPYCMGSLYWQINDCWPVASWSSTDYYHRWKAMHYRVKEAFAPILITAHTTDTSLIIHGISDRLTHTQGMLQLKLLDFSGNELWKSSKVVTLNGNSSVQILEMPRKKVLGQADSRKTVLLMEFRNDSGALLSSNLHYFEKPKDLILGNPKLTFELVKQGKKAFIEVRSDRLVRNLYLNLPGKNIHFSNNYFDVLPGETHRVEITGEIPTDLGKLKTMHL